MFSLCDTLERSTWDGVVSGPAQAEYMLPGQDAFTLLLSDQRPADSQRFTLSSVFSSRTSRLVCFRVIGPPHAGKLKLSESCSSATGSLSSQAQSDCETLNIELLGLQPHNALLTVSVTGYCVLLRVFKMASGKRNDCNCQTTNRQRQIDERLVVFRKRFLISLFFPVSLIPSKPHQQILPERLSSLFIDLFHFYFAYFLSDQRHQHSLQSS